MAPLRSSRGQDSTAVRAQDPTVWTRDGWIVGPLIGLPGTGSASSLELLTLGVGVTRLVPNQLGLDFPIGTLPIAFEKGMVPIAARSGPTIPLALGRDAFFIPSAGLSAIGFAGSEGIGGLMGWYWGAAAVVAQGSVGLRAGVTLHKPFVGSASPVWLAEIGFMHVPLPPHVP